MSFHPHRPSLPSNSPTPDTQGPRHLHTIQPLRGTSAYPDFPGPHEYPMRAGSRTSQSYEQRNHHSVSQSGEYNSANPGRQPNLSLDTRNLVPPSDRTPSPIHSALQGDFASLKAGLESLWTRSARTLHTLHHALATEREARNRVMRERELLADANARMWEDKARLEGEKRELRAKLEAQSAAADMRDRAGGSGGVRIKVEETEDDDENVNVPIREVQRMIEERLRTQADQFAKESTDLYSKLAASQTRTSDLEAYLAQVTLRSPSSPVSTPAGQGPSQQYAGQTSPVTPHTGQPSSHSDREYLMPRSSRSDAWPGEPAVVGNIPLQDSRAFAAIHTNAAPSHHHRVYPPPRDLYPPAGSHPNAHHQSEVSASRTASLPMILRPTEPLLRRAVSASTSQHPSGAPILPPLNNSRQQPLRLNSLLQQQPQQAPTQSSQKSSLPRTASAHPTYNRSPKQTTHHHPLPQSSGHHHGLPQSGHTSPNVAPQSGHPSQITLAQLGHPPQNALSHASQNNGLRYKPPQQVRRASPPVRPPVGPPRRSESHIMRSPQTEPQKAAATATPAGAGSSQTGATGGSAHETPSSNAPPGSGPGPGPQGSPPAARHTPSTEHSRPGTPTSRPAKRVRSSSGEAETRSPLEDAHEMTDDERRTLNALSSVLTKKRDGAGWKCVLCRQEKKNPTATFSENTPIGIVTQHVRGVHTAFWEKIGSPRPPDRSS